MNKPVINVFQQHPSLGNSYANVSFKEDYDFFSMTTDYSISWLPPKDTNESIVLNIQMYETLYFGDEVYTNYSESNVLMDGKELKMLSSFLNVDFYYIPQEDPLAELFKVFELGGIDEGIIDIPPEEILFTGVSTDYSTNYSVI